jgi:hypothetical protein
MVDRLSLAIVAILAMTLALTRAAAAAPRGGATDVDAAEQLYAKLEYEKALDAAEQILKQHGLTHDVLVRATRLVGVSSAILGKNEVARQAFFQLLVYEPDIELDTSYGPKATAAFQDAREKVRALPTRPGLEVSPSVRTSGGQLKVTTHDPTHIAKKGLVGLRWTASGEYTISPLALGDATVAVPPAPAGRTRLDFYVAIVDDRDDAVYEAGSARVPKSAFAEPDAPPVRPEREEQKSSFVGGPLFWVIAGTVLAGGGTALFFVLRAEDKSPTSAILSPVIRCGNDLCK